MYDLVKELVYVWGSGTYSPVVNYLARPEYVRGGKGPLHHPRYIAVGCSRFVVSVQHHMSKANCESGLLFPIIMGPAHVVR